MVEFGQVFEELINAIENVESAPSAKVLLFATEEQQDELETRFKQFKFKGMPLTAKYADVFIRTGKNDLINGIKRAP